MDFGAIIKRSWQVTWRHKALWVLGIFAGISGCAGGGGGGGGGNSFGDPSSTSDFPEFPGGAMPDFESLIPALIAFGIFVVALSIVWWVFAIAARGALVTGVNDFEEDHRRRLSQLWGSGFSRFGSLFGLELLLRLPLGLGGLALAAAVVFSVVVPVVTGGESFRPELFAPLCGVLGLGVPLLLGATFVLGIMYLVALRYVMLAGQGAVEASGNAWRFLRARFKDTTLMWFLNFALNIAASFVLAIPAFVLGIVLAVPFIAAIATGEWASLWFIVPVAIVLIFALSFLYSGVWGTYTSALWTLFFRRAAGMHVETAPAPAPGVPAQAWPPAPPAAAPAAPAAPGTDLPDGPPVAMTPPPPPPPAAPAAEPPRDA